jgi:hypothetical protein
MPGEVNWSEHPYAFSGLFGFALLLYLVPVIVFWWCWWKSGQFVSRYDFLVAAAQVLKVDQIGAFDFLKIISGVAAAVPLAAVSSGTQADRKQRWYIPLVFAVFVLIGFGFSYWAQFLIADSHERIATQYGEDVYQVFFTRAASTVRDALVLIGVLLGFSGAYK